ncbi:MAG: GDP-mannose 4,6-dehydratase [Thermoleophilaceae bacterium]
MSQDPAAAASRPRLAGHGATLVTGGKGFAGGHLVELLSSREGRVTLAPPRGELDLRDRDAVRRAVADTRPATVFHLAAFSSPSRSWEQPDGAVLANVEMTLNVLEAVRHEAPGAGVVLVGSGQAYGEPDELPVTEDVRLEPLNPYAVSKASSDMLGRQYAAAYGMRVVRLRPFNHAGPGQSEDYVVSTLARQVAAAEAAGADEALIRTGDPDSARDFTDVRDVVRAYALAAELDGGAYNVCSGHPTTVRELVEAVSAHARIPVRHEVDPGRLRAHDARTMHGSHERLTEATGWQPEIPLEQTVRDTLDWWRERLARR